MRSLELLDSVYRRHHASHERSGFVFCGPERRALFRDWVGGPDKDVVDLGCRDGSLAASFLDGNRVVGVDVDRAALARAAERGIEPVWGDADEPLPFEDETFDAVVCGELLEHLRFPDRTLREASRVLRPGGVVVGSVPNAYRLKSRLRFLAGRSPEFADDPTHLHLLSPGDVLALLAPFERPELRFVAGTLASLSGPLFANDIAFRAWKPPR